MSYEVSGSKRMYEKARRMMPGGVNSPVRAFKQVGGCPIFFKSGKGSGFRDADGNEYVDFCQSWGPLILGHAREEVVEAVKRAAESGLSFGACHEKEAELASLILEAFPEFDRIRFVNSGTEAVMTALRLARGATGRNYVIKFEGGYHGHFDGMLVKAGSGLATHAIASSAGIPPAIAGTTLVAPFDDESVVEEYFKKYGEDIAAVILEPLPANNGLLVQRKEYLEFLRNITEKHGALLVFDEVISGFRLTYGGYSQVVDIEPDIITLGKVIGGGMPVGAIMGQSSVMDKLSPEGNIYQAGTLSGNPVSLAAGIAVLDILKKEPPYERLASLGRHFVKELEKSGISYARAQQKGSIVWLYMSEGDFPRSAGDISKQAMERFTSMYWKLLENGYYLPPSSFEVMFISAAHSEEEIEGLAASVTENLKHQG